MAGTPRFRPALSTSRRDVKASLTAVPSVSPDREARSLGAGTLGASVPPPRSGSLPMPLLQGVTGEMPFGHREKTVLRFLSHKRLPTPPLLLSSHPSSPCLLAGSGDLGSPFAQQILPSPTGQWHMEDTSQSGPFSSRFVLWHEKV